ncbi:phosphate ABC transporter membrane protein 2, PhoT family (TC 3.A.1.7.1) [Geosporobacter subterraneus DSM 17957]|uniref:Phosphate transport system permease protein PstA n=1 Tax=Geosporobacter subterraneus DSM 17957 TaxID=1121919 RepID=A0A1M6GFL2_9FIRM|nr:phosphate ABC transporter permease PstA [Geosporobacter subterraneus]SHJ08707.1 phosphate ABC transporter membrane protein 2, PhoT family (TC 3.A.1.7.1) [Geosporobacter subterraneus DSM 17957]
MEINTQTNMHTIKRKNNINSRKLKNKVFHGFLILATTMSIIVLALLLYQIFSTGFKYLSFDFLNNMPSRFPHKAGIKSALVGSIWVISLTALFSFPLGVGTAIYLEKYSNSKSWLNKLLQINIANLAGVPSIVYGMLGLAVFVRFFNFERSILSGALTLTLLILPVIIVAAQEAIKSVPDSLIQGSFALGVTKWQTITGVVLPYALPGILTGTILAISRAMGEAAPLIMVGAAGYIAFMPSGPMDSFTVLPIQIFNWTSRPQAEFQNIAAAGIIVLMALLLTANATAIILRNKYQNRTD